MKVMVIVKATASSEAGTLPSDELLPAMSRYNEELIDAGLLAGGGDGLQPSARGKRIHFSRGNKLTVVDGPFAETKELVAGYWIWQVGAMAEAVAWARRCPHPMPGEEGILELRPMGCAPESSESGANRRPAAPAKRRKDKPIRVMAIVKATEFSEAGGMPGPELVQAMTDYTEELTRAGILIGNGEGLEPSASGKRIHFSRSNKLTVVDGPFAETKELVAGFWMWQVGSLEEAVDWARRCPHPMPGEEGILELRPLYEIEEFAGDLAPQLKAQEERLRAQTAPAEE